MILSERAVVLAGSLQTRLREVRFPLTSAIEGEIQREVSDYADELRALGLPAVRVILAVHRAGNDAGLHLTFRNTALPSRLDCKDKLLVDMVGWCIQRYCRAPRGR